jgi:hypothetical protein
MARIEREVGREPGGVFPGEVTFTGYDDDGEVVTAPRVFEDRRRGEWVVHPGPTTNRISPEEARIRAAALMAAADECAKRNEAG